MKLLFFVLTCAMIMSCDSHSNPSDNISFGQALSHLSTKGGYWLGVTGAVVASLVIAFFLFKNYKKTQDWTTGSSIILFVCIALIIGSILIPPAGVAANTTVEQAARGVYIR